MNDYRIYRSYNHDALDAIATVRTFYSGPEETPEEVEQKINRGVIYVPSLDLQAWIMEREGWEEVNMHVEAGRDPDMQDEETRRRSGFRSDLTGMDQWDLW